MRRSNFCRVTDGTTRSMEDVMRRSNFSNNPRRRKCRTGVLFYWARRCDLCDGKKGTASGFGCGGYRHCVILRGRYPFRVYLASPALEPLVLAAPNAWCVDGSGSDVVSAGGTHFVSGEA